MKTSSSAGKSLTSIIAASSAGTLIEWYDFFIFGSLATIISTQFFPKENPAAAFLATLATFSAGLLVRPLGALFFGRLGDMIGRKYTFMVTLVMMGISTVGVGLVPGYDAIGFLAPLIVLILRLLQGLALGGEFGGAVVYVAEHSPKNKRGFYTSWIQSTTGLAFIVSIMVILLIKSFMDNESWLQWGWRLPFLGSVFLVGISLYIRHKMAESPLFAAAKAKGKISKNPLKDSFGNKENLKVVLLAFFGLAVGGGAIGWIGFYAQSFLLKTMMIDYDQANFIIIIGILLGIPFFFFFGWLSDKIGRKPLLILGMFLGLITFRPIFKSMFQVADLQQKTLEARSVNFKTEYPRVKDATDILTFENTYSDGTKSRQVKSVTTSSGKEISQTATSITVSQAAKWKLIFLVFLLQFVFTMANGPLAAFMVEMFPLKIRYTSISLPYHFGFGIFGGLAPYFATYFVNQASEAGKTHYYLAGLNYSILLTAVSVVIGLLYIKENNRQKSKQFTRHKTLNLLRKWLGIVWMLLSFIVAWYGILELGIPKIASGHQEDIVFGIIITTIITPSAVLGLFLFGKYAYEGAYDH